MTDPNEPGDEEFDRSVDIIGKMLVALPPPHRTPAMTMIGLLMYKQRSVHNLHLAWSVDEEAIFQEGLGLLARHLEVVKWIAGQIETRRADNLRRLLEPFIHPDEIERLELAVHDPDCLHEEVREEFISLRKFMDRAREG